MCRSRSRTGRTRGRLSSVLAVVYLIFNEGYSATAGDDWMRPQLCEEALRLGRILAELAREEAESMASLPSWRSKRRDSRPPRPLGRASAAARSGPRALGSPAHSPRSCRSRARGSAGQHLQAHAGSYALQAAIAACHARAPSAEETDWARIVGLYGALAEITPSPIVDLNRAVALAMLFGRRLASKLSMR